MRFSFFIYLFLLFTTSWGQGLSFYHYGLKDGLSQQTIRCILKDDEGFLWIGTQDGLNKFDGTHFKVFKNHNDSLSISGNYINKLIENTDRTIWVATDNNGVCYYNPNTGIFNQTHLNQGRFLSLSADKNGNVYTVSPDLGLFKFFKQGKNYIFKKIETGDYNFSSLTTSKSQIFIGTNEGTILVSELSNPLRFKKLNIQLPKKCSVEEIISYKDDYLLVGTSLGLFLFDSNSGKTHSLNLEKFNTESPEKLFIESIKSNGSQVYVGTDNGLFVMDNFDKISSSFKNINVHKGDKENDNSITSNRIYDILLDNDLLWIGTNNLDVVSLKPKVFKTVNTESRTSLNNNYVFSILKTDDYTFIGTRNGLNCIDTSGNTYIITKENTNQKLAYNVIRGMAIDANNNLWLATTKGVSVLNLTNFNPKQPELISMYFDENNPTSLSNNKTRSVFVDNNNTVWITTYGGGLNRFTGNLDDKKYSFVSYQANDSINSISSDYVFNISQDDDNNYWITSTNGLNRLSFKNNYKKPSFKIYRSEKGNPNALQNNTILHTFIDNDSIIWVATQGGLYKFNRNTEVFEHYNENNGLTNNYVYNILQDKDHKIWISTNEGLFKFDKTSEEFEHYTTKDGIQSSEFNLGAYFNDTKNNLLYFGGVNGYNEFNPRNVYQLDVPSSLKFTSLVIKNTEVNPITHPKILKTSFNSTKEITLNFDDFPCYINFSDLDLRPTKNNQFVYALNNEDWNNLENSRKLQILNLPKGKHLLKIQGKSRNKIWSSEPLKLNINVTPPWYKSNLAYSLYFLMFITLGYILYKLSLQRQLAAQEAKRLRELDDLKSQFITNITHEFKTPLTIILGYINTLKKNLSSSSEIKNPITSIEQSSNNLLKLVNEMLDLAKLEKGKLDLNLTQNDLVSFTKQLVNGFNDIAKLKSLTLTFSSSQKTLMLDFDLDKMHQILNNLISNAIKYNRDKGFVAIHINKEFNQAIIKVEDSGIGIPESEIPFVFDRFYQSSKTKDKVSGTGIGLSLTKELITLMRGSIDVTSDENSGTTFTIHLPIQNQSQVTDTTLKNIPKVIETQDLKPVFISNNLYTVLIVEDNLDIAQYIASCLDENYNLLFAQNGQEGLTIAINHIPDIIITDIMMPLMDGHELTQQLQNTLSTNHIPIIMLTAKAMQEDKLTGIKSGADAYLTKPFNHEELLLRIEKLITKRKQLQEYYQLGKIVKGNQNQLKKDKNIAFLNLVIDNIKQHIEDVDYNATQLASHLNMSESQLYRKLKAITNKSTAIFIRSVKLEHAKELLQTTTLTVSEIAYTTGFSNPNWFGKAFKEEFGKTPSEVR